MTARTLASPATEIRRLRAEVHRLSLERDEAHRLLAELVDALPDHEAEVAYRAALCREATEAERERSRSEGYAQAIAEVKRAEHGLVRAVHLAGRRADPGGEIWLATVERHGGTEYGGGQERVPVRPEIIDRARKARAA